MFYVAHLSGWDVIVVKPGLQDVCVTISASTTPVTMQPPSMYRYSLCMWRGNRVTDKKSDLSIAANSILARADELAVSPAQVNKQYNPVAEFAALSHQEIH